MKISTRITLDCVAEDVLHLILSELVETSPAAVLALSQTSTVLRRIAFSYTYWSLVLAPGVEGSKTRLNYQSLLDDLSHDGGCQIAKHVRSITVKDNVPTQDLMFILNQISTRGVLHKLSWETSAHMPQCIFDKIHATWPGLKMTIRVTDRRSAKILAHRQMDTKLLCSPLLHTLFYTVYTQGYDANQLSRSEWPRLTQSLLSGGSIRILKIRSKADGNERGGDKILGDDEPLGLMRLALTPDTRLPPLEELSISPFGQEDYSTYLWDNEHCRLLHDSADWSRLLKLDFGAGNPSAFFQRFQGALPQLRSLRFGCTKDSLEPASDFIESLTALESLDIYQAQAGLDVLWNAIMKHRKSLNTLILRATHDGWGGHHPINFDRLEEIAAQCPSLQRFGCDIPCEENVDCKTLQLLSSMNLKKLDLFIHLPKDACAFSDKLSQDAYGRIPAPPLKKLESKEVAFRLMETIFQSQAHPLQWLTLHFTRTGFMDRFQPYLMSANLQARRSTKGAHDYEFRGQQKWCDACFDDELQLEEE